MKKKITFFAFMGFMALSSVYATQNIYVATPANGGNDSNDGTASAPFATLSKATSVVSEDGAIINVAAGTYVVTAPAVLNAFSQTINGDNAATTILDGNNAVALIDGYVSLNNSGKTITIKNLAFKNGALTVASGTKDGGSAISIGVKTNLVIEDCWFSKNTTVTSTTESFGGAVYFAGNNITVNRCLFEQNASNSTGTTTPLAYGGAITVRHLLNTTVGSTTHVSYGATYAVIKNSTFYKNSSFAKGGAVYFNKQLNANMDDDDATFVVQNCDFLENTCLGANTAANTAQNGAALAISSGSNSTNNKMQTIVLTNNTFCNNTMMSAGTVYGKNTVLLEGFRYTAFLTNNIMTSTATNGESLFGNQPMTTQSGSNNIIDKVAANIQGADFNANAATKSNQVATITATAIGLNTTLTNYPVGTSFALPYLSLQSVSMAINTGTNSYLANTVANPSPATPVEFILQADLLGSAIQGTKDIGAYEFSGTTTALNSAASNSIEIRKNANGAVLSGLVANANVNVFNMDGKTVLKTTSTASELQVNLPARGMYIISVNGQKFKYIH